MSFEKLLSPIEIGNLTLKNRMVMPAMGTGYANEAGTATDRLIDYFAARAKGGAGLLIVEATAVHPLGLIFKGECGIFHDRHIPGFKRLTSKVHEYGSRIAMQLAHGGRQTKSTLIGAQPLGPSAIPAPALCTEIPRAMTVDEIQAVVRSFGDAARRAKEAGFDAVEIHGAHGYLVNQFLASNANQRTDRYGGNLKNRAVFALEVVSGIRKSVGPDFPIFFRLSGADYLRGGVTLEEAVATAPWLVEAGTDAVHVSAGVYGSYPPTIPLIGSEQGCFVSLARAIKDVVTVPVIAAGRIKSPSLAEKILTDGSADMVTMGRALMADPDLPNKVKEQKTEEIRPCVGCGQACIEKLLNGIKSVKNDPITCLVNPYMGREGIWTISPASQNRRVLVVGGGPGGIQAALVAAQRGHEVLLYEKKDALGGNLPFMATIPGKTEFNELLDYLLRQVERSKIKVVLNHEVDLQTLEEIGPEAVVIATGATFEKVEVPGMEPSRVFTPPDVLAGAVRLTDHVLVLGADQIGLEMASFISAKGKEVTVAEQGDHFAPDMGPIGRFDLLETLAKNKVKFFRQATLISAANSRVTLLVQGKEQEVPGDFSVVSVSQVPDQGLSQKINLRGMAHYLIGDALQPRKALEAIEEAHLVALSI
jgi:2,4-dienoyl-CoA reductase-like NADH-dependent reductase (Old Yellow Enzyme family)/thioredoxin reductase